MRNDKFSLCIVVVTLLLTACGDSPQQSVQRGEDLLTANRNQEAELEFRKALQADSNLASAQAGLARSLARQGTESEALPEFRRAVRMLPSDPRLLAEYIELLLTGITLVSNPDPVFIQELSNLVEKLKTLNGPAYDRFRLVGAYAAHIKDWPTAIDNFQQAAAVAPPLIFTAPLGLARALYLSGEKAKGVAEVERLLGQNSRSPEAYDMLYFFALYDKDPARGEAVLERAYAATKSANSVLALARHFERNNAHQKALDTLKRLTPRNEEELSIPVGEFLLSAREPGLAIRYFDLVRVPRFKPRAVLRKIEATVLNEQVDQAKKLAESAIAEFPQDHELATQRAAILLRFGNEVERKSAEVAFEELRKKKPDSAHATFNLAVALAAQGRTNEAGNLYREAIRQDQLYIAPKLGLGEIELRLGHGATAARLAQTCLELDPGNWNAKLLLASANAMLGFRDESSKLFRELAKSRPKDNEIKLRVAFQQLAEGKFKDAESAFRSLYEPGNSDYRAVVGLANALSGSGQVQAAIQVLESDIKVQKNPTPLKFILASTMLGAGQIEPASRLSSELLQSTGESLDALLFQSEVLQAQGKVSEALSESLKALAKSPANAGALKRVAFLNHISGSLPEAEKHYRLALQQDKQAWDAANNLATMLTESGKNLDEAERLGRALVEAQPQNPSFQDTLAWALVKRGRPQEAVPMLRSLTQKFPDSALLAYHHGAALLESGQASQGKAQLIAALKKKGDPETLKQISERLKSL
jgi:tetratricopeptide (TPR) repeat protein